VNEVKKLSDVIAEARAEFEALPAHVKAQVERNRELRQFVDAQELGSGTPQTDAQPSGLGKPRK